MKYPRLGQDKRKPDRAKDGNHGVGKPCIVCDKFTLGIKWMEVDYMRGNDVEARVCFDHWKGHNYVIIEAFKESGNER